MTPNFPIISFHKNQFQIIQSEEYLSHTTILALSSPAEHIDNYEIDSNLDKWKYGIDGSNHKLTAWKKFLAKTFYNPVVKVNIVWKKIGSSNIKALKENIYKCLEMDDDILTQFIDAQTIIKHLTSAQTFNDICDTINKFIFELDVEELYKEFDEDLEIRSY